MTSVDIVWLILDSVSFEATSFASDGPQTTPKLAELAAEHGVTYTKAHSPGPASPSGHASLFTNELPSVTGTHEAAPSYDCALPTVASVLSDRPSLLVSANPFVFNGLDESFDITVDLTGVRQNDENAITHSGSSKGVNDDTLAELSTLSESGSGEPTASQFRNGPRINEFIKRFRDARDGPSLIVANYMDAHPPYTPFPASINRVADHVDPDTLPIGVPGHELTVPESADNDDETSLAYRAAIHSLDRTVSSLIRRLIDDGAGVFVTADHGDWVRNPLSLNERVIRVPLVIFAPNQPPRTVQRTVNTRHLPVTTMELLGHSSPFSGYSLLSVEDHRMSVSESIHERDAETPVAVEKPDGEIVHDVAAVCGEARVERTEGDIRRVRGDKKTCNTLRETVRSLVEQGVDQNHRETEYDETTLERLEDLGYRSS